MADITQPISWRPARRSAGRPTRASYHERLQQARDDLDRAGGLPSPSEAAQIWTTIWYDESHNSTALEGNTLVIEEVEALLGDNKKVGDKPFKDYLEVTGYAKAAEWVYKQAVEPSGWGGEDLLTVTEIRQVHREVMTPSWDYAPDAGALPAESPGNWRQHNIQAFDSGMTPPDWTEVPSRLNDWLADVATLRDRGGTMAQEVAIRHAAFERIHPFFNGNGRTGRLLMNLILVRLGYPPTIVRYRDRNRYLAALARADHADPGALGEMIARGMYENVIRFILPALTGTARVVPLEALVTKDITLRALRAAAERGRLKVVIGPDRVYRSSKKWVAAYVNSRWSSLRAPRGPRVHEVFAHDSATVTESAAVVQTGFQFSTSGRVEVAQSRTTTQANQANDES